MRIGADAAAVWVRINELTPLSLDLDCSSRVCRARALHGLLPVDGPSRPWKRGLEAQGGRVQFGAETKGLLLEGF